MMMIIIIDASYEGLITGFGCLSSLVGGDTVHKCYSVHEMKQSKQLAGYIFPSCISLAPSSSLVTAFDVQSLLKVSLCKLASTEEGNSWEYYCAWYQPRTLRKNLNY